jgi:hypothetical protein
MYDDPKPVILKATKYTAIGSGAALALGAMFAGADTETAVRAAIKHDTKTRAPVITMRLE